MGQPAAFNPDAYLAEKTGQAPSEASFNPNQYLKEKVGGQDAPQGFPAPRPNDAPPTTGDVDPTNLEAFGRGALHYGSLGYYPQDKAREQQAYQAHPWWYRGGGLVGGGVAGAGIAAAAPEAIAGEGLGILGAMRTAGTVGAMQGAAERPSSEYYGGGFHPGDRAINGLIGGAAGLGAGGLIRGAQVFGEGFNGAGEAPATPPPGPGAPPPGPNVTGGMIPQMATEAPTVAQRSIEGVKAVGADLGESIGRITSPPVPAPTFPTDAALAQRLGINPDDLPASLKFGPTSQIARYERFLREGPEGEQLWTQFNKVHNQIQGAVEGKIANMGGGQLVDPMEAGNLMRSAFKEAQEKMFNSIDLTMENVRKYAPGLKLNSGELEGWNSQLDGLQRQINGAVKRSAGADKAQYQALQEFVDAGRKVQSYPQAVKYMRILGDEGFKTPQDYIATGKPMPRADEIQKLYFGLQKSVLNTVEKDISPDFAKEIVANNKIMSDFFQQRELLPQISKGGVAPEDAFNKLFKNGNSDQIAALQKTLSPETFASLRATYLNSLIKRAPEGYINYAGSLNNIQRNLPQLQRMFDPMEISEMRNMLSMGNRMGPPVLSTSGTGASSQYQHFVTNPVKYLQHKTGESIQRGAYDQAVQKGLLNKTP